MAGAAPLLCWREDRGIERMREERLRLIERIGPLPKRSDQRIALQGALARLTAELLAAELQRYEEGGR